MSNLAFFPAFECVPKAVGRINVKSIVLRMFREIVYLSNNPLPLQNEEVEFIYPVVSE